MRQGTQVVCKVTRQARDARQARRNTQLGDQACLLRAFAARQAISPLAKGLFHGAIAESGVVARILIADPPEKQAKVTAFPRNMAPVCSCDGRNQSCAKSCRIPSTVWLTTAHCDPVAEESAAHRGVSSTVHVLKYPPFGKGLDKNVASKH
ncbi:fatty acyl-CoA hydrolase precursor, medium chain-like [Opisthocomus hoazin]|uniref:fatty acyl-CoA hydrolase precursor, medium chain-like n=1 Tax=Opisthocomus hoazin TaxID=30419 RepID=UPI003F52A55A